MAIAWLDGEKERFAKVWEETTLESRLKIPSGTYEVRVDAIRVEESKNGNRMIVWELMISSGKYLGKMVKKFSMMTNEENISFLKKDLLRAGLNPRPLDFIEEDIATLIDKYLVISLKDSKDDFQYVYIDGTADKDIPF